MYQMLDIASKKRTSMQASEEQEIERPCLSLITGIENTPLLMAPPGAASGLWRVSVFSVRRVPDAGQHGTQENGGEQNSAGVSMTS